MIKKGMVLLNAIADLIVFVCLMSAMLYAKDLMQTMKYGFVLLTMTIIKKK